jgi:hypothetical protein
MSSFFHLISGGLEFLEISAIVNNNFDFDKFKKNVKVFSEFNNIPMYFTNELPDFIIGKMIFIKYKEKTKQINLKALHHYYDGISMLKICNEIDKIYNGEELKKKFHFTTPVKNNVINRIIEASANVIMNKNINTNKDELSKPKYIFKNLTSSEVIKRIQELEQKDIILLCSSGKLNKTHNDSEISNKIIFKYVKYGEDFKEVLKKDDYRIKEYIKMIKNKKQVIFLNNLCSFKLPSYIEKLTPEEHENSEDNMLISPLVIYPKTNDGLIEVFKG